MILCLNYLRVEAVQLQSQAEGVEALIAVNESILLSIEPRLNQLVKVEHLKVVYQDGITWRSVFVF